MAHQAREVLGIDVFQGDLASAQLEPATVDLIIMSHVLEHFLYSLNELAIAHWALKPDGSLYIEVPNIGNPNPRKSLRSWLAIEHVYYYTPVTLARLLALAQFEAVETIEDIYIRLVARKHPGSLPSREWPNEYYRVLQALRRHELRYWPWRTKLLTASLFRALGRKLLRITGVRR